MSHKILIIGETCIDEYVFGVCNRVCPEAAALCFTRIDNGGSVKNNLGMAGNVYSNMVSLYPQAQIDILTNNTDTSTKIIKRRYIDKRYNTIVFREDINDSSNRIILDQQNFEQYDAVVISDYDKGFLYEDDYETIATKVSDKTIIFADTKKKMTDTIAKNLHYLKINFPEYKNIQNFDSIKTLCSIIVTNGGEGATLFFGEKAETFPTSKIEVRDVCGAGDTFLAGLVVKMLLSRNIVDSINYANECAGKVVSKLGVCVP